MYLDVPVYLVVKCRRYVYQVVPVYLVVKCCRYVYLVVPVYLVVACLGKVAAATRAALPSPANVCDVLVFTGKLATAATRAALLSYIGTATVATRAV